MTIVKVQVPLFSTAEDLRFGLVYARGKVRSVEQELPNSVIKALKGDPKGYFNAQWLGDAGWAISNRVANQNW